MHSKSIPVILSPYSSHWTTSHLMVKINLVLKDELYLFITRCCRNAVITTVYDNNSQFALNSFSPNLKTSILWLGWGKMSTQMHVIFTSPHHSVISFRRRWNNHIYTNEMKNYWRVTPYLRHFPPPRVSLWFAGAVCLRFYTPHLTVTVFSRSRSPAFPLYSLHPMQLQTFPLSI